MASMPIVSGKSNLMDAISFVLGVQTAQVCPWCLVCACCGLVRAGVGVRAFSCAGVARVCLWWLAAWQKAERLDSQKELRRKAPCGSRVLSLLCLMLFLFYLPA